MRRLAGQRLAAQALALLHAEAMLLVNHSERQIRSLEGLRERGVRGHHDARFAAGCSGERPAAGGELHAAGQEDHRRGG